MSANPYYSPEKCGLTLVAEIEYSDQCYCYDTRVVWRKEDGGLVTARDSGCSCPTPFEDSTPEPLNSEELQREVSSGGGYSYMNKADGQAFIEKVREAMAAKTVEAK